MQKFLQLNLEDNDDRIGAVVLIVFDKAINEYEYPYPTAYAKMV